RENLGSQVLVVTARQNQKAGQECRYLVKDFGTSQSPKSTRQRDSRYCPDRPALITTPSRTLQQSCSCATPS
ncbi:MAG: hypothetical protein KZQ71_20110, partial [Candidatus Thiodiazotropha sp. (ex Lucinoma aequizonata)]|nr:hypothetical protein [Candidatus Thiodiazotropha sp. (ex Lucinoma aequizonata)]